MAVSVFDEYDNLLDVTTMTAEPIYYDNGTYDALFYIDGKEAYLSELVQSETENCFFFTALFSALAATIVTAIVKAIVVSVVIVAAVVVVGYATYELVKVTKEWIEEKKKENTCRTFDLFLFPIEKRKIDNSFCPCKFINSIK